MKELHEYVIAVQEFVHNIFQRTSIDAMFDGVSCVPAVAAIASAVV